MQINWEKSEEGRQKRRLRRWKGVKKLFISQPMRGKTDEEIFAERENAMQAAKNFLGEDVEVIDTWFGDFDGKALEFLGKSILLLAQADFAYFAPGWDKARGCVIEHQCAVSYGVPHIIA